MDLASNWLRSNADVGYFFYGLVFIIAGVSILVYPKRGTQFKLADVLWLLCGFYLLRGIARWLEMWCFIRKESFSLHTWHSITSFISFLFLFMFGRYFSHLAFPAAILEKWKSLFKFADKIMILFLVVVIYMLRYIHDDFTTTIDVLARYLLAFPGGVLSGLGFIFYYKKEQNRFKKLRLKKCFILTGSSFLAYGVLGGLIVPKNYLFFASWLNDPAFLSVFKVPAQVFRSLFIIIGAAGVINLLKIFNWEKEESLQHEIKERKLITEAFKASREFYRSLIEISPDAIISLDKNLKISLLNKSTLSLYGYASADEVIGRSVLDFVVPEERQWAIETAKEVLETGSVRNLEFVSLKKDGAHFFVEVSAAALKGEEGSSSGFILVARDITQRKEAEEKLSLAYEKLKEVQAQLVQTAKMAAVGQLAGGVAHEINNPLTGVLNNAQLIKMMLADKKGLNINEFRELLDIIEESALRCKKITTSLLDFSRASTDSLTAISVNELVEKVVDLTGQEMRLQNIAIEKELEPDLPRVSGDLQLLEQVLLNLVSNASWAVRKKGQGKIKLKTEIESGAKRICLSVSDTGIGIPQDKIEKLFEPFFTTKAVGEGTGLGLSVTHGIVKRLGGVIEVESRENEGTTFKVFLPVI